MSEIGVRLTGDNAEFKSMLDDSTSKSIEWGGKLSEKIGDKLIGLRDVSHAVATALGLNLEKIAENLARSLTGMSKEIEDIYKELDRLDDEHTARVIKNIQSRQTDSQKQQQAAIDIERSEKNILDLKSQQLKIAQEDAVYAKFAAEQGTAYATREEAQMKIALQIKKEQAKIDEAQTVLAEKAKETKKQGLDIEKEAAAAEISRGEQAKKNAEALMPLDERRLDLETRLADAEQEAGHSMLNNKSHIEAINRAKELENQLAEVNRQITERTVKAAEQIEKANFENLTLDQKSANLKNIIAVAESALVRLKEDGKDLSETQNFIEIKKAELTKVNLEIAKRDTEEKKKQVAEIDRYLEMTDQAIVAEKKRVEIAIATAKALGLETAELERQLGIISQIVAKKIVSDGLNGRPATAIDDNYSVKVSGAEDVASESTDALVGHLQKLQEEERHAGQGGGPLDPNASLNQNYGDWLTKTLFSQAEKKIQDELNLRSSAKSYAQSYGQSAAVQQFGDTIVQRSLTDISSTQNQTLLALKTISTQLGGLSNNGLFPIPPG